MTTLRAKQHKNIADAIELYVALKVPSLQPVANVQPFLESIFEMVYERPYESVQEEILFTRNLILSLLKYHRVINAAPHELSATA